MTTAFGDLVAYDIGGGWGTDEAEPDSTSIGYVIRGTDIPRVALGDVSTVPLRFHKTSNLASRILEAGDIVFEVSGGSRGQPVGRALHVTEAMLAKFDEPVMCASFCKLIRLRSKEVLPGYVFRVLQAAYADGRLDRFQVQSTGITNFKWKAFLEHFQVELPERHVQERVVSILNVIDELIENNRRRVGMLEEMARAIYREWFVRFRYPGHESDLLVDSDLGPIPEGWELSTCGRELSFIGGGTPSKSEPSYWEGGDVAWYTPTDLTKTGWRYAAPSELSITEAGLARSSARLFPAGSVLMTSRATLGVLAIATTAATTNQGFIVILPDARWSPGFIHEWLDSKSIELAALGTGATFKEITKGAFKNFPFVVPDQAILDLYSATTQPLEDALHVLEQHTRSLSSLRGLLLPKLVTGQIDVSGLDLDMLVGAGAA